MATALDIANRALGRLGEQRITALDEGTRNADSVSLQYEPTVLEILRLVPWTCAKTRTSLAPTDPVSDPLPDPEVYGFSAAWNLPAEILLPLELASGQQYLIEGSHLFTDDEDPVLVYVYRAPEAVWDPLLASAIELRLASKLALEFTSKANLSASLFQEASAVLADARRQSLFESFAPPPSNDWWTGRP